MIIGDTLLAAIVAGVVLYVLPAAGVTEGPEQTYTTETSLLITPFLASVSEHLTLNVSGAVQAVLNDPRMVGEVYRGLRNPVCPEIPPEQTEVEYLSLIRRQFLDERLSVTWTESTSTLTIGFSCTDAGTSREFVQTLVSRLAGELQPVIHSQVVAAQTTLQDSLSSVRRTLAQAAAGAVPAGASGEDAQMTAEEIVRYLEQENGASIESLSTITQSLERIRQIDEEPESLYGVTGQPITTVESGMSRSVVAAVVTIAVFFMLVFLAFVRQYAHNVRNDPEEIGKLRAAWKRDNSTGGA